MSGTLGLCLLGSSGRMGASVETLLQRPDPTLPLKITQRIRSSNPPLLSPQGVDVVLDFSSPEAVLNVLEGNSALPPIVIGSTGWTEGQLRRLHKIVSDKNATVLKAANFSLGVLALQTALEHITPLLRSWGYQASISETHHVHKKDAPSGTALSLAQSMGSETSKIPIESHRIGEVIGKHTVLFKSPMDSLTLEHEALDRAVFARGAALVCVWLVQYFKKQTSSPGRLLTLSDFKDLSCPVS